MEKLKQNLLWIDGGAGATVGALLLIGAKWISDLYDLPLNFIYFVATANLLYGCYSLTLASRRKRPMALIRLLIGGNLLWSILCIRWFIIFSDTASVFGLLQLGGEAVFVGGLGILEWRWRTHLQSRSIRPAIPDQS